MVRLARAPGPTRKPVDRLLSPPAASSQGLRAPTRKRVDRLLSGASAALRPHLRADAPAALGHRASLTLARVLATPSHAPAGLLARPALVGAAGCRVAHSRRPRRPR